MVLEGLRLIGIPSDSIAGSPLGRVWYMDRDRDSWGDGRARDRVARGERGE